MAYTFNTLKILEGSSLILKPMQISDLEDAAAALVSPATWFSKTRNINSSHAFHAYFEPMIKKGESLTLLARLKNNSEIVGMSTYQYPSPDFRKVEIGFSWVADKWQHTFVNTEMKLLMLRHAFTEMKTNRVEFSIHPKNERSNKAIIRIGAKYEGTLRKWRFLPGLDDGHRNIYSIIDDEWPAVESRLQNKS